jgi:hypothetical protein
MIDFSSTATPVYELTLKFPRVSVTERHMAGWDAGKVTPVGFLKALVGLLGSSVPFVIRRRK